MFLAAMQDQLLYHQRSLRIVFLKGKGGQFLRSRLTDEKRKLDWLMYKKRVIVCAKKKKVVYTLKNIS